MPRRTAAETRKQRKQYLHAMTIEMAHGTRAELQILARAFGCTPTKLIRRYIDQGLAIDKAILDAGT